MRPDHSRLWLLTGQRSVGKTTFCGALASHARLVGWSVGGLLTPAIFTGADKTGILVESLVTGETRPLASLDQIAAFDLQVGKWYFDRSVIEWGNQVIQNSVPCDLLIIDEFGPMEFLRHKGWWDSVDIFDSHEYLAALVVVRPELQEIACEMLNVSEVISLDAAHNSDQSMQLFVERAGL